MEKVQLKTPEQIAIMREAGRIVALAHQAMKAALKPGISTLELDRIAEEVIRDHGATPAFLGYPKYGAPNFPATITASVNHELVHGIPSATRFLKEGDIISLDTGCHYQGWVGDCAYSYVVGEASPAVHRLLQITEQALYVGIEASVVGNETRDVGIAIQRFVEGQGYSVIREYTGHGVGQAMHEAPSIPNWWHTGKRKKHPLLASFESVPLQVGMTYAIEPMVNAGLPATRELEDLWTVVMADGSLCAHFEHTIAITADGPLILTLP